MEKRFLLLAGVLGFLAVLLGAFGAHILRARFTELPDGPARLGWWETAAHYHLVHAVSIGLAAYVTSRSGIATAAATTSGACFALGILLFSGSLYAMSWTGVRWLGAITPLGGLLLLAGWGALALAAWRLP
jgi:uncharacterized membrane protein YgdD (TMEM256/DUF423 family)